MRRLRYRRFAEVGGRFRFAGPAAVFALALVAFGALFQRFPVLYDTDSYYHLAVARAYARHGLFDTLPWAQLSLLHEFGDKELLFHLVLAPFAESTVGGRFALALLNAALAALLAGLGQAAAGRWGLAAPLLVYGGSLDFLGRMIRLRPEILSLGLLLVATWCAARGRYRWLGVVAFLYALSYTAFHALLGLAAAWLVQRWWAHGRREWGLLLYPLLGVGLGLLLHPQFPQNLVIWKVQSLDFFLEKGALNVGAEIRAPQARELLSLNLAWGLALLALWRARRRGPARPEPMAELMLLNATLFGVLYFLMLRFSTYFVPFATLAVLYEAGRRGGLGRWVRLPWRGRLPLALALAAALALGLPRAGALLQGLTEARGGVPREAEWHAFGRALPPGARVAAEWGSAQIYMYWAPQATFLNLLDPVFMKVRYPRAYDALRAVFEDRDPDVPRTLAAELQSDHLALSRFHQPPRLIERLDADPRLRPRHAGYTLLYELVPEGGARFVRDWRVVPRGSRLPPAAEELDRLPSYPLSPDPELRALEAYVDARRAGADGGCTAFARRVDEAGPAVYELAPYGPTRVWWDDALAADLRGTLGARLDHGLALPVPAGARLLTVLTCPGDDGSGHAGFYLLRDAGSPGAR